MIEHREVAKRPQVGFAIMRIPADEEILALHERHAPTAEALDVVYSHCVIVCRIAEQLLPRAGAVNADLVRAGCLLHDIGVYRLYDEAGRLDEASYIRHGVLGHELLQAAGLAAAICRFASCHTGVGLSSQDVIRQGLPIPVADYLAETPEEALVMYADKFHTKSRPPRFLTPEAYAASVRRFGEDKAAAFEAMRARFGDPDALGRPLCLPSGVKRVTPVSAFGFAHETALSGGFFGAVRGGIMCKVNSRGLCGT
jgi:uncharacterized protein